MTLIIGYGNSLRRDDAFGPLVAARLAETLDRRAPAPAVEIITCLQLTVELCEPIAAAERVLFLDAAAGDPPGELEWHVVTPAADVPGSFSHHVHPALLLTLARELYGRAPEAALLTVAGADFEGGEALSAVVDAAVEPALEQITAWFDKERA